jgi:hypothetical protein
MHKIMRRSVSLRSARLAVASGALCLGAFGACGDSADDGPRHDAGSEADDSAPPSDGSDVDATLPEAGHGPGDAGGPSSDGSVPGDASSIGDATPDALDAPSLADGPCGDPFGGGPITTTTTHLDIGVHDPSMTWDGRQYYLFATGGTLDVRSSADMLSWANVGNIFGAIPAWVTSTLGANPGSLWAPDISYFGG